MRATRPFHILSVSLICAFLFSAAGPAQAAPSAMPLQTTSPVQGGELLWNTFLGTSGTDEARGVAIDADRNIYIVGLSRNTWGNPVREITVGPQDAYVAKLDSSGALLWNTFLGGSDLDEAWAVAVDGCGIVTVTGLSFADWGDPVNAFAGGPGDAFVASLDANGNLLWNTFLGGTGLDNGFDIAVDAGGNSYVVGWSDDPWGIPVNPYSGGPAYVAKLDGNGALVWNSFLNGSGSGIALDGAGNVYVAGQSQVASDALVAKLDSSGALAWYTFLAGSASQGVTGIAVDADANAYVVGDSRATWGSPIRPFSGICTSGHACEVFVAKVGSTGELIWNTFLGSPDLDEGGGIALDTDANAYVIGDSLSTWGTPVRAFTGCDDNPCANAFVARVDHNGELAWNTFLGGGGADSAVDREGNVYAVGNSGSTWGDPVLPFPGGLTDAFVAKLRASGPLYVKDSATGSNDGTSWADAYASLQSALAAAGSGDQVWVAEGTYQPTEDTNRTVSFGLKDGVAIYGGFSGVEGTEGDLSQRDPALHATILSGDLGVQEDASDNSYHVVVGDGVSTAAVLDGFTITGGNADTVLDSYTLGGGMYNYSGSPTLTNLIFSANAAGFGGGIYNDNSSSPQLTSVTFISNTAVSHGGGMYNYNSNPTLSNATFSGNTAQEWGGGMYNDGSSPTLTDVSFAGNEATSIGGGMYNWNSAATLTNVTFSGNTAATGGGMSNDNSSPTVTNVSFNENAAQAGGGMLNLNNSSPALTGVTFSANAATAAGGGMYNAGGSPTLTNVTINGNTATQGGGMENEGASPTLTNVTIAGNTATTGGGMHNYAASSPSIYNSIFWGNGVGGSSNEDTSTSIIKDSIVAGGCPTGAACTNVLDANPKLGPLQDNGGFTQTRALLAGSAAIDKGYNATCATADQRGYARPQDGNGDGTFTCDLGAYEAPSVLKLRSIAAQDGWVLESGENTNTGGSFNADGPTFIVGDDAARRQYRSIVSFKTGGLPDNAVIVSGKLKLTRQSVVPAGGNPFNALQGLMIDARKGYLGTLPALQAADFKATGVAAAGPFKPSAVGGVYTIKLPAALYASINTLSSSNGLTQLRLRFKLDDDNDAAADYIKFFSGNHQTVTYRPLLVIQYYAP